MTSELIFQIGETRIKKGTKIKGWLEVAEATSYQVKLPYIVINGIHEGPTITILSGVHSIEAAPIEATLNLTKLIEPRKLKGRVIVIPVVNTEGFHTRKPYENLLDHLNQNKVFPGDPTRSITSQVAYIIFKEFVSKSDYLIDCHSADLGEDATRGMFIFNVDDEELTNKMMEMASCFNCDYIETIDISGNTGEAVKTYGIPCIMTESGTPYDIRKEDIEYHTQGIINFLRHRGMLEGKATLGKPKVNPMTHRIWAKHAGIWRKQVKAGQRVKKDMILGEVVNLHGETKQVVRSPLRGVISFLRIHYNVNQGDTLLWIKDV